MMLAPPRNMYSKFRSRLVIWSAVAALLFTFLVSNDYCFAAVGAAILSMVLTYVADRILCVTSIAHRRRQALIRISVALGIPLLVSLSPLFRLSGATAFQLAFGMSPPSGIDDLQVQRRYAGGPGDYVILLSFRADTSVVEQIISQRGLEPDQERTNWWLDNHRSWSALAARLTTEFATSRKGWWQERPAMNGPEFWFWRSDGTWEETLLIWDAESGLAYAAHGRG